MAFLAKLGGLARQSIARSMLQQHSGAAAIPALYLVSRGMASSKLFVGGEFSFFDLSGSVLLLVFSWMLESSCGIPPPCPSGVFH